MAVGSNELLSRLLFLMTSIFYNTIHPDTARVRYSKTYFTPLSIVFNCGGIINTLTLFVVSFNNLLR